MTQQILFKYFTGHATIEEEREILDWVSASDENRKSFQRERMLYDVALFANEKQCTKPRKAVVTSLLRWGVRIAAVVVLALAVHSYLKAYQYSRNSQLQTVTVPAGQRARITLADGTNVWLNAKSTLTYATDFGREERRVELDGEAYFEVTKNQKLPFYVHTEKNKIAVLGTSFNVCAYRGTDTFETTLVEGTVDIYRKEGEKPIARLEKNEFFANNNGTYKKGVLPSYEFLRWKEGLYCFDDAELSHMLKRLEQYYNVTITVNNPKLLTYRCTGKFKEQDGIEHVLKVIQKDLRFSYHINEEENSITLE